MIMLVRKQWLVHVFVNHTNIKIRVSEMTSFVYKYTVMTPMHKIITRICFFRQEIVQYMVGVTQYCLKQ